MSILEPLRKAIEPLVDVDRYAFATGQNEYTVRSVYFDTPRFDYYFEKIEGVKNRKKVRIRAYSSGESHDNIFLEIKRKYDIPLVKYRVPYLFSELDDLLAGKKHFDELAHVGSAIERRNINRFLYQVFSRNLRPVVLVVYEREAYLSKFDPSVRITFDKDLRGKAYPAVNDLFDGNNIKKVMHEKFILEIKFNRHFPQWLRPLLAKYGLKKRSASKYTLCMDRCGIPGEIKKSTLYTRSVWDNLKQTSC